MNNKIEDFKYLDQCIRLIKNKNQWIERDDWQQKDFEFLIDAIFKKTKVKLSLSTIKRIWNHGNEYMPRISTLDAMVNYLGYDNWQQFKIRVFNEYFNNPNQESKPTSSNKSIKNKFDLVTYRNGIILFSLIVLGGFIISIAFTNSSSPTPPENISLTHQKTVNKGVPTSILFNYDLKDYKPDSAYIQLSWNRLESYPIALDKNIRTCIYYSPGWHQAKLIANNTILAKDYVYIETEGWLGMFRYYDNEVVPIYLDNNQIFQDGTMYASPKTLTLSKADTTKDSYYVSFYNSTDFNIDADNFSFETTIQNPSKDGKFYCQYSSLYIYTENSGIYITFGNIACASTLWLMVAEKEFKGKNHDLTPIGINLKEWQKIKGVVKNKKFNLFINDNKVFETSYDENMGSLKTWHYFFRGSGMVEDLIIKNEDNKITFKDDFNRPVN